MDESQQTKPIRRSELRSPSASPEAASSNEEVRLKWQQRLCQVYNNGSNVHVELDNAVAKPTVSIPDQPDEAIYDFRLFSGNAKTNHACDQWINKVRIESPTPVTKEPGFVHPRRSEDYYFTGTRSDVERRRYEEATVNGEQVLKESRAKWPGFELPWRVTTILERNAPKRSTPPRTIAQVTAAGKRRRNGKKKRIAIRIRTRAQSEREAVLKRTEVEKQAMEAEKRNRRNREKKIKRREKARAMKKEV